MNFEIPQPTVITHYWTCTGFRNPSRLPCETFQSDFCSERFPGWLKHFKLESLFVPENQIKLLTDFSFPPRESKPSFDRTFFSFVKISSEVLTRVNTKATP